MTFNKLALAGAMFFLTTPMWASTYFGGFEDTVRGDYDYNDIVFQITGATLVQSGGVFSPKPVLDNSGTPFWNHTSADADHNHDNIGYCIYGFAADSGTCAGASAGFSPSALYLATAGGGSVNDVTFTPDGATGSVLLTITADTDELGWYNVGTPGTIHWLNVNGGTSSNVAINTTSAFGLVGNNNNRVGGDTYYSQTALGNAGDSVSHFAFFATPTPEPATMVLLGSGFLALGIWGRRKRA